MHHPPAARPGLAILAIALIAAACTSSGSVGSVSVVSSAPSARPPTAPSMTTASPTVTIAPAGSPDGSALAIAPPAASLSVEGGEPVTGQLGSYTWNGVGSDSPWLPGTPITVGTGERLSAALDSGVSFATWSARRVAAGSTDGAGGIDLGDGSGPIAFPSPAVGRWSLQLTVRFPGDLGSAAYYWDLTVR